MELNKCFGCMEEIQGYPCPHCGFDPRSVKGIEYALPMGTILAGNYLVGRVLGQGGFGITYVGWDIALERKVAIKEYYPSGQVSRNPGSRGLTWYTSVQSQQAKQNGTQMFLKEARKMSKVDDIPNVVRVRDLFQENETAYIVMDFVEGETLKARLEKTGPLPWEQAKGIFLPAIQAMEQVHQAGLVHRDISPDNLMLTPDGKVKILDLGAAKDLSVNNGASSMQVAKGGFSPFEQYTQRGSSGPWTDVYAMAATVYYTLTGKLPPVATDRVVEDTISWEEPGLKALSAQALEALQKAMVISAKNRMQSMEELEKGLYSTTVKPEPAPAPQPMQETRPEPQPAPGTRPAPEETKPELKPTPEPAPQAKPEAGKKSGKKLWIATAAVIAVVLCGALVWANAAKPVNDDKQAQVLTNETKYSEPTTAATTTATAAPTAAMPVSIPFSAEIGSTVEFGHYEQNGNSADGPEPIEWYVLSKDENANTLLLLSVYGLDNVQYHKENKDITWAECDLREWLNSESGFWGTAFSGEEKERIESTLCKTPAMDFPGCQTVGGDDTVDKIFLLSLDEFWDNGIGDNDDWRNVSPTPYALSQGAWTDEWGYYLWWLRTPGGEQNVVCDGRTGGARSSSLVNTSQLLRPALWVVADEVSSQSMFYGLNMTEAEFEQEVMPLFEAAKSWTKETAPQNFSDFPFFPESFFEIFDTVASAQSEMEITGPTLTWRSNLDELLPMVQADGSTTSRTFAYIDANKNAYEHVPFESVGDCAYSVQPPADAWTGDTFPELYFDWDNYLDGWTETLEVTYDISNKRIESVPLVGLRMLKNEEYVIWWGRGLWNQDNYFIDIKSFTANTINCCILIYDTTSGKLAEVVK